MMTPAHHQLKLHPTQITARAHAVRNIKGIDVILLQLLHLDWVVGLKGREEGGREGVQVEKMTVYMQRRGKKKGRPPFCYIQTRNNRHLLESK